MEEEQNNSRNKNIKITLEEGQEQNNKNINN